jgi:neutral ceramidase
MKPCILLLVSLCVFQTLSAAPTWKAAVTKAVITPDKPLWMAGYASRKSGAEGKLQDLFAKALMVEDASGERMVIITLDLIGVPRPFRLAMEKAALAKFKLPASHLLINASHTHSGPMIRVVRPIGKGALIRPATASYDNIPAAQQAQRVAETLAYMDKLHTTLLGLIGDCIQNPQPVKLAYSHARCGFAMNRRLPVKDGFRNSPNPDGPVDHDVPVLQVRSTEGKLLGILFGYACHNTTTGTMKFNGDYAGWAQEYLEADNPGAVALFVTGCGADQNPYPRGTIELAKKHGRSLATAVEAGLIANPKTLTGSLRAALAYQNIDYSKHPTRPELEARAKSPNRYDKRYAETLLEILDAEGALPKHYPVPVQVIRFGDQLTMVTMGGEVVVDYSLRLKRELGNGRAVWVAGYSNDVMTYIPSLRVLTEGGYEGGGAMRYVRSNPHPSHWARSIEKRLVDRIHLLDRKLTGARE